MESDSLRRFELWIKSLLICIIQSSMTIMTIIVPVYIFVFWVTEMTKPDIFFSPCTQPAVCGFFFPLLNCIYSPTHVATPITLIASYSPLKMTMCDLIFKKPCFSIHIPIFSLVAFGSAARFLPYHRHANTEEE